MRIRFRIIAGVVLSVSLAFGLSGIATAQYSSPNYQVNETFIGSGGELDASSPNYQAKQSIGETSVGNTASSSYQAQAGFNTSDTPLLEMQVTGGTFDFGTLDESITKTVSTSFSIRNYLASGYVAKIVGDPPTNNSGPYSLAAMSVAAASSAGTEQFGINLRANTSPSVGADPVQVPDSTFSFGTAATGYNTPNQFKYVDGDTIAQSGSSSGTTNYTISMIANIATTTPGGQYGGSLYVVVVPTF